MLYFINREFDLKHYILLPLMLFIHFNLVDTVVLPSTYKHNSYITLYSVRIYGYFFRIVDIINPPNFAAQAVSV